jgi:hypothetical protein
MPTPDEIFEQVLAEETAKGSSPAVAQSRAKAARVRAQKGAADPTKAVAAAKPAAAPAAEGAAAKPAAAATATKPAAKAAPAKKAAAGGNGAAVPERVQRLLAVVKPEAIQKIERQPMDRVNVWPHLMAAELVALVVVMVMLTIFSTVVDAPLRQLANFNQTPNPSKAPWYFLGLQELLTMFHPMVAGVTIPGMGLFVLGAAGYIDKNPSNKPEDRKFAITMMTFFLMFWAVLVIIGSFFRGEGFNFIYPWRQGVHEIFDL